MDSRSELLGSIFRDIRRLFHQLALSGEALHGIAAVTMAQRALLEDLAGGARKTIAELAAGRAVSRQQIQKNLQELEAAGLVVFHENPEHKRAFLSELTVKGERLFSSMQRKEAEFLADFAARFGRADLQVVARTLIELRSALNAYLESGVLSS
ncbi:MAG: MarR family transcriptional regulator [Leptospirales bacterium]|nr:MarR family transcriptional regulator [Leptospirales bacterium]